MIVLFLYGMVVELQINNYDYCLLLYRFVLFSSVVSFVVDGVDNSIGTENNYLSCITNANSDTIVKKHTEYAESLLSGALLSNLYSKIDDVLVYINNL